MSTRICKHISSVNPHTFEFSFCPAGYEVCGMENVPDDSPALIIYYHGAVPVDVYYFLSKVMLFKNRMVHTVADRFLFKIPGMFNLPDKPPIIALRSITFV